MNIQSVFSDMFRPYGRVIKGIDFSSLIEIAEQFSLPCDGVVYEPGRKELEETALAKEIRSVLYGEMPIQIGYCGGVNFKLNGLEYHRSSEINVACKDVILLLGLQKDVSDAFTYDTSKVEAFLLPKGYAVELYATCLHFAPCCAAKDAKFLTICVLPKGTNTPLETAHTGMGEDALLLAKNKWLIGHSEADNGDGVFNGLVGKNIDIYELV